MVVSVVAAFFRGFMDAGAFPLFLRKELRMSGYWYD